MEGLIVRFSHRCCFAFSRTSFPLLFCTAPQLTERLEERTTSNYIITNRTLAILVFDSP